MCAIVYEDYEIDALSVEFISFEQAFNLIQGDTIREEDKVRNIIKDTIIATGEVVIYDGEVDKFIHIVPRKDRRCLN